MVLPLRFLREDGHPKIKLEEMENFKLDTSACENHCFERLLCGFPSSSARKKKNDVISIELDNNLKHCLFTF